MLQVQCHCEYINQHSKLSSNVSKTEFDPVIENERFIEMLVLIRGAIIMYLLYIELFSDWLKAYSEFLN